MELVYDIAIFPVLKECDWYRKCSLQGSCKGIRNCALPQNNGWMKLKTFSIVAADSSSFQARANLPAVIFIDEIDAIVTKRSMGTCTDSCILHVNIYMLVCDMLAVGIHAANICEHLGIYAAHLETEHNIRVEALHLFWEEW